jgi:membrane protease YdiL (CAAX protease family)
MENGDRENYYSAMPLPVDNVVLPTPNDPPWGVFAAIGMWVASVVFIVFVPAFLLLPYLATRMDPMADAAQAAELARTDPTAIFLQIIGIIPAHLLTLLLGWLIVTRGRRYSFRTTLGWINSFKWWQYVAILAGFMAVAVAVNSVYPEQENEMMRILNSSRTAVYVIALVATFTAPLVEEVVYRGVVFSAFQRRFGVAAGFVTATLLFALVHVPQYMPSYSTIFLLTLLSVTLTWIRVVTGNLLPCIILHTLFNGFQSVMLILEPYLRTDTPAPDPTGVFLHLFR